MLNKTISPKLIALTFGVLTISFLAVFYIFAWTEPSLAPPGGNVATPINVGSASQTKTGNLVLPNLYLNAVGFEGDIQGADEIIGYNDLRLKGDSTEASPIYYGASAHSFYTGGVAKLNIGENWVALGSSPSAPGAILFILGSTSYDFGSINGGMWYNTALNKFRCMEGGVTKDCIGGGGGGGGTVTSVGAINGLTASPSPITTSGSISLNTAAISACTDSTASKIIWDSANSRLNCATDQTGVAGSGYNRIRDDGAYQTQRTTLYLSGAGVDCYDSGGETRCDIASGGGGGLPVGSIDQTLRHNGTTWVADSAILNYSSLVRITQPLYMGPPFSEGDIFSADQIYGLNDLRLAGDASPGPNDSFSDLYIDASGNVSIPNGNLDVNGTVFMGWERVVNTCPSTDGCFISCSVGKKLLSGGCDIRSGGLRDSYSTDDDTWYCGAEDPQFPDMSAYAICALIGN